MTCFRSGMWRLQFGFKFSAEGHKRYFREFMPLLHETKHEVLGDCENESWYLVYIGTKPHARGRGYARALIESVTNEVSMCLIAHGSPHDMRSPEASPNQSTRDLYDSQRYGSMRCMQIPQCRKQQHASPQSGAVKPKKVP